MNALLTRLTHSGRWERVGGHDVKVKNLDLIWHTKLHSFTSIPMFCISHLLILISYLALSFFIGFSHLCSHSYRLLIISPACLPLLHHYLSSVHPALQPFSLFNCINAFTGRIKAHSFSSNTVYAAELWYS